MSGAVKARPILMSGAMVRALLHGRKTQTRRVVKSQPPSGWGGTSERTVLTSHSPYGQVGDLLWVRETWAHYQTVNFVRRPDGRAFSEVSDGLAAYRADGHDNVSDLRDHIRLMSGCDLEAIEVNGDRWRPSIHMPRWASRLTLELTDICVERLQDISETDAIAEGIEPVLTGTGEQCGWLNYLHSGEGTGYVIDPRSSYAYLWESINGPGSWIANPWVWVLAFDVHRKNVDALLAERGSHG